MRPGAVAAHCHDDGTLVVCEGPARTLAVVSVGVNRVDVLVGGDTAPEGKDRRSDRADRRPAMRSGCPWAALAFRRQLRGPSADVTSTSR